MRGNFHSAYAFTSSEAFLGNEAIWSGRILGSSVQTTWRQPIWTIITAAVQLPYEATGV